jgi:hypothetical protein
MNLHFIGIPNEYLAMVNNHGMKFILVKENLPLHSTFTRVSET